MKLKNYLLLAILMIGFSGVKAQENGLEIDEKLAKKWLVTIEGDTTTAGDFWYLFNKNNFDKTVPNIDSLNNYRELYSKFLLKVRDAGEIGLDTTKKFLKEFNGYKNQLAESYLKDKSVTESLVKQAYERSLEDVEASHVLINIKFHALPNDTLIAYKTALKVQKLARKGQDFKLLAEKYSQDPSAKSNGGYLGFFTAFKMVYAFENGAYDTKVGEVSEIVRTRFGYHVLKVHSRRKAIGEIKVAHIMMILKDDMDEAKKKASKERVDEVYEKLNAGESFETLARKFSEDQQTKSQGGELPWFGAGKFVPEFETTAFNLANKGDYSKPVKTKYGWHIIKLLDNKKPKTFSEAESELKNKVVRSDRAEKSEESVLNRIKKDYNFKENRDGINTFFQYCDTTLLNGKWKKPEDAKLTTVMFSFAGNNFTQKEFAEYLGERLVPKRGGEYRHLVNYSYDQWIKLVIVDYEKTQLGAKHPDYLRLLKEYRDGIILFELTDQMVWSKALKDTTGLKDFHSEHAAEWVWNTRIDGTVYKCTDLATATLVRKYLKKKKDDVFILENINKDSKLNVRVEAGVYQRKDIPEVGETKFKKGVSKVAQVEEAFTVLKVNKVIPTTNKTLEEVKGLVTAKYQEFLMEEWLKELAGKYKLEYNEVVYKQLVK
jgi:peptidyl-prolyl cis-trans isomerase SurA